MTPTRVAVLLLLVLGLLPAACTGPRYDASRHTALYEFELHVDLTPLAGGDAAGRHGRAVALDGVLHLPEHPGVAGGEQEPAQAVEPAHGRRTATVPSSTATELSRTVAT